MNRKDIIEKIHESERYINTHEKRIALSKEIVKKHKDIIEKLKNELRK